MKKISIFFALMLMCILVKAQQIEENDCDCNNHSRQVDDLIKYDTDEEIERYLNTLSKDKGIRANSRFFSGGTRSLKSSSKSPDSYIIPVVFHVFGTKYNNNKSVTVDIIKEALRLTNNDFQGLTPDWESINSPFDKIKKRLNITFKLAQVDPDGNPTTGVTFNPEMAGFGNGEGYEASIQKYAWDNYRYMNVYIMRDLYNDRDYRNSGVAWYPHKLMSDYNLARIVYNGSFLGTNTNENFRSILTHEIGHWLDLRHTFREKCYEYTNEADELIKGDLVADTPPADRKKMGVDELNCRGEKTNTQNFMNYTSNYAMFTKGQVERMVAALNHISRKSLWQKSNLISTGVYENDAKPRIVASTSILDESFINDGSINGKIKIKSQNGATFKSESFKNNIHYSIENLPEGLNPSVGYISNTELELSFTGVANSHNSDTSICINILLKKEAFSSDFSQLENFEIKNIKLSFKKEYDKYHIISTNYRAVAYIENVKFVNINNSSAKGFHSNYIQSIASSAMLGSTHKLSVAVNKGKSVKSDEYTLCTWIDWNGNFVFEESEKVMYNNVSFSDESSSHVYSTNVTIPVDAVKNKVLGMRVYLFFKEDGNSNTAYSKYDSGEAEDYGIYVIPDNSVLKANFVNTNGNVNFSTPLKFTDISSWNKNTNIKKWEWEFPGGTPASYSGQKPPAIFYTTEGKYSVSLKITDSKGNSNAIEKRNLVTAKYSTCKPNAKYKAYSRIINVNLGSINSNHTGNVGYVDLSNDNFTILKRGETYDLSVTAYVVNSSDHDMCRIRSWIDWNYNSKFDENELVGTKKFRVVECVNNRYRYTTKVTVPVDAILKETRMRTLVHYVSKDAGENACTSFESGEIEDYGIIVKEGTKNVIADFRANITDPGINQGVIYTDMSSCAKDDNIIEWKWDFKGGSPSVSDKRNPDTVRYQNEGVYDVSLKITTIKGKTYLRKIKNYINAAYKLCSPEINRNNRCFISNVSMGGINNSTSDSKMPMDYSNSYHNQTDVYPGKPSEISVTINSGNAYNRHLPYILEVWADWNRNGVLEQNELIGRDKIKTGDFPNLLSTYKFVAIPPANATIGKVLLRVKSYYSKYQSTCRYSASGEIEDYTLNVKKNDCVVVPELKVNKNTVTTGEIVNFTDLSTVVSGKKIVTWEWSFPGSNKGKFYGQKPVGIFYDKIGKYSVSLKVTTNDDITKKIIKHDLVNVEYNICANKSKYSDYIYIPEVRLGTIANLDRKRSKYSNYSDVDKYIYKTKPGRYMYLSVYAKTNNLRPDEAIYLQAWADWNGNGTFESAEKIINGKHLIRRGQSLYNTRSNRIFIPVNAIKNRITVRIIANTQNNHSTGCSEVKYGEIEDYSIDLRGTNRKPYAWVEKPSIIAKEGQMIKLKGFGRDSDGNKLSYKWISSGDINLEGSDTPTPSFIVPKVYKTENYKIQFFVNDGIIDSNPVEVNIRVDKLNTSPVAIAGSDFTVNENENVSLNASYIDAEYDKVSFRWSFPEGIIPEISTINSAKPKFRVPFVESDKNYVFKLIVNDGRLDSKPSFVNITVRNNINIEPDFTANKVILTKGESTTFSDKSIDLGRDIVRREWEFPGGIPNFYIGDTPPEIKYDNNGEFPVRLTVVGRDNLLKSRFIVDYVKVKDSYCNPKYKYYPIVSIAKVFLGNIVNKNQKSDRGYSDYRNSYIVKGKLGSSIPLSVFVKNRRNRYKYGIKIWADWNSDGDFSDTGELIDESVGSTSYGKETYEYKTKINIPEFAVKEKILLRIMAYSLRKFKSSDATACKNNFGEVEDYTIDLTNYNKLNAYAGENRIVYEGDKVTLNGMSSDRFNYHWIAPDGVSLIGGNTATPYFIAPKVDAETDLKFSLTVSSGDVVSKPDFVKITVKNKPVIPDFTSDNQNIKYGKKVLFTNTSKHLTGNESWKWEFEGGSPSVYNGKTPPAIVYHNRGNYSVKLTVNSKQSEAKQNYISVYNCKINCNPVLTNKYRIQKITKVNLGNISNSTDLSKSGYSNFTSSHIAKSESGKIVPLSVFVYSRSRYNHRIRVWADWNLDGNFSDDELVAQKNRKSNRKETFKFNASINIPVNATKAIIPIRIMNYIWFSSNPSELKSCDNFSDGEVEDYAIDLRGITLKQGSMKNDIIADLDNFTDDEIKIYPNPFDGNITLENNSESKINKITIYNISGVNVYNNKLELIDKKVLDLSFLKHGIYVVRLSFDNRPDKFIKVMKE